MVQKIDLPASIPKHAWNRENSRASESIPGTLFFPEGGSDVLVVFESGIPGREVDLHDYFAKPLGKEFNVYTTQLRNRGLSYSDGFSQDFMNKQSFVREFTGAKKVVYVGHSVGANVIARAINQFNLTPKGFYAISPFPSMGHTRTRNDDLNDRSLQHKIADVVSEIFPFGPFGKPIPPLVSDVPMRMAIPENDELANSMISLNPFGSRISLGVPNFPFKYDPRPEVMDRFRKYFGEVYPKAEVKTFSGKNHCFNYKPFDFVPLNRDSPEELIEDFREFVYKVTSK